MKATLSESQIPRDAEFGLFSLVHGDPIGNMIGRFAIRSRAYAVSIAAMLSFSAALVAGVEGSLINDNLRLDLLHDTGWWNQFLLAFPTLIYIAGSYFGAFPKTLRQLVDSGVLQTNEKQWKAVRQFITAKLSNPTFALLPYVTGIASAVLTLSVLQSGGAWYDSSVYIAGWLIPIHAFFLYFFMTYISLRLYAAFLILRMLFGFSVNIQPFHADGCGGLGSLLQQSEKLYWAMIVFGVVAAMAILTNTFVYNAELFSIYNFIFILSYTALTGIAFFLPLYALSESMQAAKIRLLESIAERQQDLSERPSSDEVEPDKATANRAADLDALESLQQTVRAMQVWPFNRSSLLKFACATATPLVVISIGLLIY